MDGCAATGCASGTTFPALGYDTSVDIYLDVNGGFANDTRFDFSSAINKPDGSHLRDFVFNCGFYDDADGSPGSGTNRFICSASNNAFRANAFPKNPGREPTAIASTTGWYTFKHEFRDNGFGVLTVDLIVLDSGGTVIKTWTLSDPADLIGTTVGGNRYGWFVINELNNAQLGTALAFDNARRTSIAAVSVVPDHFQCYDIKSSTKIEPREVSLDDRFAMRENVRVGRKAEKFCTTVNKNNEGNTNPDDTWTCYKVKGYKPNWKVTVENQFGQQTFKLDESELLCVPTIGELEMTEVERKRRHRHDHDDDDGDDDKDD